MYIVIKKFPASQAFPTQSGFVGDRCVEVVREADVPVSEYSEVKKLATA